MDKSSRATAIGLLSLLFFFEAVGAIYIFWSYRNSWDLSYLTIFILPIIFDLMIVYVAFNKLIYFLDKCTIIMLLFVMALAFLPMPDSGGCSGYCQFTNSLMAIFMTIVCSVLLLIFHIVMANLAKSRKKRQGYIERTISTKIFPITWLLGILTLVLGLVVLEQKVVFNNISRSLLFTLIIGGLIAYAMLARRDKEKQKGEAWAQGDSHQPGAKVSEAQRKESNESE